MYVLRQLLVNKKYILALRQQKIGYSFHIHLLFMKIHDILLQSKDRMFTLGFNRFSLLRAKGIFFFLFTSHNATKPIMNEGRRFFVTLNSDPPPSLFTDASLRDFHTFYGHVPLFIEAPMRPKSTLEKGRGKIRGSIAFNPTVNAKIMRGKERV